MNKTKLGISAGVLGALVCFAAALSDYSFMALFALLCAGYILIAEENAALRKVAVRVIVLSVIFVAAQYAIQLLPGFLAFISSMINVFGSEGTKAARELASNDFCLAIDNLTGVFAQVISFAREVLFIILGFMSFKNKEVKVPGVDKF